jgi:UDP-N-acetylglucosamine acyltransferase
VKIHPLAVIDPRADISPSVEIGPFCVIEPNVVIGDECKLESHVVIKEGTVLGDNNYIAEGAVLGGAPQHVAAPDESGTVIIGSGNTIREHVTVHRALNAGTATIMGDDNMLMAGSHLAHDCRIGSRIIMANSALLAGHVTVGDRATISGAVVVHQFTRIGEFTMVGGQARIVQDVPPYMLVDGLSSNIVGLNRVGLKRAGFKAKEMKQLKAAYNVIYRQGLTWNEILATLESDFDEGPAHVFRPFLASTTRGIISEGRPTHSQTRPINRNEDDNEGEGPMLRIHTG